MEWIEANGAVTGGRVHLSLPELGLDHDLTVVTINPCPAIEPDSGNGRSVVSGVMCHAAANIVSLEIETSGHIEPRQSHRICSTHVAATQTATLETIECTDNHPIWSADRQSFVPAGELHPGERLSGVPGGVTGGLATLVRCTPVRGPPRMVYNLEVDGEHVYHVGTTGLLVHNTCGGDRGKRKSPREEKPTPGSSEDVLQTGGHTISPGTRKGLGLTPDQAKRGIEGIKKDRGLPANFHHTKIHGNGDVYDSNTGQYLGNLYDFI